MNVRDSLTVVLKALDDLEDAVRSDDKTPLQNALALGEAKETFGIAEEDENVIIYADINDFKFVNGRYGFANGDAAISQVGILINEFFVKRFKARAFRIGGDEFLILLRSKFIEECKSDIEAFASCSIKGAEVEFDVSLSFGYIIKGDEIDFETMQARAETACKEAKRQGNLGLVEWNDEIAEMGIVSLRKFCGDCNATTVCYAPQEIGLAEVKFCSACGTVFSPAKLP